LTRREAAEKVAKLRRLADDPRTPRTEAQTARGTADKIAREHELGEQDLAVGRMCAAFDDLIGELEKAIQQRSGQIPTGMFGAGHAIKTALDGIRKMTDVDKATRLRQLTGVVRTAALFVGDHPVVAEVKAVLDTVLKNHDLML
jgi:hypothetical protein